MNYYFDIKIKPDAEMRLNVLLNAIYTKFHKELFDLKSIDIGISFPRYKVLIGNVLRVHGDQNNLNALQKCSWIGGVKGYCSISDVLPVPEDSKYRIISRKQSNMTEAKLRRLIKRGSIPSDQIKLYKVKMFTKGLDNPYFELKSQSTGKLHRRYIEFGELSAQSVKGEFDQFGLSKVATIPWF